MNHIFLKKRWVTSLILFLCAPMLAAAQSKILATPGAMQLEGSAGGGIVPWAVIGSYGHEDEWGASAALTKVQVNDLSITSAGFLLGVDNRWEFSVASQQLRLGADANAELAAATAGAWTKLTVQQDIFGVKARLAGDLIYGQMPLIAVGLQHKVNRDAELATQVLGAHTSRDNDYYVSATKLYLDALAGGNLLVNATARYTAANQAGLLGFGANGKLSPRWVPELSVGWQFASHWLVGMEYRKLPNGLASAPESRWADAFVAWFPNKRMSVVAAYADLGDVALWPEQRGWYLSVQINN